MASSADRHAHRPLRRARAAATASGLIAASLLALVPALAPGAATAEVTAVYPPWWNAARAASAAASVAEIVGPGRLPFLLVIRRPGADGLTRLREHGALFLLNLGAGACRPPRS